MLKRSKHNPALNRKYKRLDEKSFIDGEFAAQHCKSSAKRLPKMSKAPSAAKTGEMIEQKKTLTQPIDFEKLIEGQDILTPLLVMRDNINAVGKAHRKRLKKELVNIFAAAQVLRDSRDKWFNFCNVSEWENCRNKPDVNDGSDALLFVLRYVLGLDDPEAQKRASKYHIALKHLFDDNQPPDAVERAIVEGGGIEALARTNSKKRRQNPEFELLNEEASIEETGERDFKAWSTSSFFKPEKGMADEFEVELRITRKAGEMPKFFISARIPAELAGKPFS